MPGQSGIPLLRRDGDDPQERTELQMHFLRPGRQTCHALPRVRSCKMSEENMFRAAQNIEETKWGSRPQRAESDGKEVQ